MVKPRDPFDRDIMDIIPERYDGEGDDYYAPRSGSRLKTWATIGVAVLAIGGLVAFGLRFMGGKGAGGNGIPVIKADERPIKVRPDDRGGMQVPNQDKLIYGRLEAGEAGARVERLLPGPEAPQVPPKAPSDSAMVKPNNGPESLTGVQVRPPLDLPPVAVQTPAPIVEPPPVAPSAQALPAKPPLPAPAPVAKVLPPAPAPAPKVTVPAPPPPPPAPAPAPVAPAKAVPAIGGDWLIQLGALRSAPDAEKEWGRIQRANSDILSGLKPDIVRVELPEKGTYWRVRGGPLSENGAKQLCNELKNRNQGCIVARK